MVWGRTCTATCNAVKPLDRHHGVATGCNSLQSSVSGKKIKCLELIAAGCMNGCVAGNSMVTALWVPEQSCTSLTWRWSTVHEHPIRGAWCACISKAGLQRKQEA